MIKLINKRTSIKGAQCRQLLLLAMILCISTASVFSQPGERRSILLNNDWLTIATDRDSLSVDAIYKSPAKGWKKVTVPHNWDEYEGYRRLLHGNRHGDAWYKKSFTLQQAKQQKRFFLYFEGVGSYAYVYLNGVFAGEHKGGRTTFTIDVTSIIKTDGSANYLAVRASHPAQIKDLPWVCGGCSDERGFSEGSQPMGIFRPVQLIVTSDVRIEPFGLHAWADIQNDKSQLFIHVTIKNYSQQTRNVEIINQLLDKAGKLVTQRTTKKTLAPGDSIIIAQENITVDNPFLWAIENPYLYKLVSIIKENNNILDRTDTDFGFRTINWKTGTHQFLLNDKPVFINGIAEYEHLIGQSHAFSKEQVLSRINWIMAAGFNAFRDGHQPHNLLYGQSFNKDGILWWTQLSAHIWYDTPEFRNNFKQLLREWVIERRNDPAVILWGLQNESKLPEDFAKECTELIRQLDPTASSQRLVTTCNGGTGTDWDVPQNWTGTYGGDPNTYAADVRKQVLIGEYGAWRTLDLHTEGGFVQSGAMSEDRMVQLMEKKIRLAESVKDSSAGQFFWLLTSHDNPGRVQGGEGLRELDRVGPVNYKGLLTPWEEPSDAFYMFRSNYAAKSSSPMVYIVSHTWPGRWMTTGKKDSINVYSNCDEVELFNDIDDHSLGKRKRNGVGTHFQWDGATINYNVLYAIGYVHGKPVARDTILLHHLPAAPHLPKLYAGVKPVLKAQPGYNYIYRINCGGPDYIDEYGHKWSADRSLHAGVPGSWGSVSWTNEFVGMPSFFASQRRTFDPIKGTREWELFQDFRYGKDKLQYELPLPDGEYLVELFFIEPWLGIGGGMNAEKMRLFDIAINDKTVLQDIDIWKEAGTNTALKKTVKVKIVGSRMVLSFPQSKSGQAIISAIAVASLKKDIKPARSYSLIDPLSIKNAGVASWLDIGDKQYAHDSTRFRSLPSSLFGADWLKFEKTTQSANFSFHINDEADVFIGIDKAIAKMPGWVSEFENTQTEIETDENGGKKYQVYRKRYSANSTVPLRVITGEIQYPVFVLPVTNMQPAYDLKQVSTYRSNVSSVHGEGINREMFADRPALVVHANSLITIVWPIQTGVADIYSITVKYYYPADKLLNGKVQLIDASNTILLEEKLGFTFTRPGKTNTITFNTGSMINAGNYEVKLILEDAVGLVISGIDVQ